MEIPFLRTKVYLPPIRAELVSRPRLVERLSAGLWQDDCAARKLTLISAPAGFGKTTLVATWIRALGEATPPVDASWLSLDESDNDPVRFLTYIVAAFQTLDAGLAQGLRRTLQSPQPPPVEAVLAGLINEVAELPHRVVVILDDYHLIDAQPVHDALTFLLHHMPPQLHLVIVTREDPPLPLARLRARSQLTELRAADLRFTPDEAVEFLNHRMGLALSTEEIAALETRTEGWIAGLQLAALALQGTTSTQRREDVAGFIASFTGSHRFVLDYLVEEVLYQQTETIQAFLLQTSVLERLTAPLCDAVTGQDDGAATLAYLDRANLFLVPLDGERRWYRYHHLFADLLRQRLHQARPDQVPALHVRAGTWYEQHAFVDDAIEHMLHAKDFQRAITLIEQQVDAAWARGAHAKLRGWLHALPEPLIFARPQLALLHVLYMFSSGRQAEAERSLEAVEQILRTGGLPPTERLALGGRLAATKAFIGSAVGDAPAIIQHAHQALEDLPEQDLAMRGLTAIALGDAYAFKGDMAAAYRAQREALAVCEAAGDVFFPLVVNMKLANTLRAQGHLQQTAMVCRQQIALAEKRGLAETVLTGCLLAIWGEVLAELGDLEVADRKAQKGVALAGQGGNISMLGWSYLCMMRILFSRGDMDGAKRLVERLARMERDVAVPAWITNQMATWQGRLWLAQGRVEVAAQWAEAHGLDTDDISNLPGDMDFAQLFAYILVARISLAQDRPVQATALLPHLFEIAKAGSRTTRMIEILLLQAMALQAQSELDQAMVVLERALTLAEPEGFVRIFADEGAPMAILLYEALRRGVVPDYAGSLLAAFPFEEPEAPTAEAAPDHPVELIEPLSEREVDILCLIAEGLTNREIAGRLYLSLHTIKTHNRNIYGKLDVHNRMQAVAKARALGLLPSV
jgi:LuxR family maltose regulon positive regulatory protein